MSNPDHQQPHTPTHLRPVSVLIPATWTPDQAMAVFELIEQMREKIFALYCFPIQDLIQKQQGCFQFDESDPPETDAVF